MSVGVVAPEVGNRRGRDTRRRILRAAEACFEERGIELTLDEVARAAHTTRMTVHRHTGGREALLTHLVLRASARLADRIRVGLDGDGPFGERLAGAVVAIVVEIRASPHLQALFTAGDPATTWPEVDPDDRVLAAVHAFFRPYVAAAAEAGLVRSDVDGTVDWLLRQVLLFLLVPSGAPDEASVRRQVEDHVLPSVLRTPGERRRPASR